MLEKIGIGIDIVDINRFLEKPYFENKFFYGKEFQVTKSFKNKFEIIDKNVGVEFQEIYEFLIDKLQKLEKELERAYRAQSDALQAGLLVGFLVGAGAAVIFLSLV